MKKVKQFFFTVKHTQKPTYHSPSVAGSVHVLKLCQDSSFASCYTKNIPQSRDVAITTLYYSTSLLTTPHHSSQLLATLHHSPLLLPVTQPLKSGLFTPWKQNKKQKKNIFLPRACGQSEFRDKIKRLVVCAGHRNTKKNSKKHSRNEVAPAGKNLQVWSFFVAAVARAEL